MEEWPPGWAKNMKFKIFHRREQISTLTLRLDGKVNEAIFPPPSPGNSAEFQNWSKF